MSYALTRTQLGDHRFYNPPPIGGYYHYQPPHFFRKQHNRIHTVPDWDESTSCSTVSSSASVNSYYSNLDRIIESVTPAVTVRNSSEAGLPGEGDRESFFCLGDLWESFKEWSAYGVGVPLLLNGKDIVKQYYVPSLSGIQLYVEPGRLRDNVEACCSRGLLVYQYLEQEQPHHRQPLYDKVSMLASQFPDIETYRSCDLSPESWVSVAWYPIYRIPMGPSLQNLDASFLTLHSLSSHSRGKNQVELGMLNGRKAYGTVPSLEIPLPFLGLASYKLRGSILNPGGIHELQQANSLLQAADNWLRRLNVNLPDFQFFLSHASKC